MNRFGVDLRATHGRETAAVAATAVLAGVVAMSASARPTGLWWWDSTLTALLAVAVTLAASYAPRWATIAFAAAAVVGPGFGPWFFVGLIALALALAAGALPRRSRLLGGVCGALGIQVLLRLSEIWWFGIPSLVAGLAAAFILLMGYRYGTRTGRAVARRVVLALAAAMVLALLIGGFTLLSVRTQVEQGVAAAERGVKAVRAGDTTEVTVELARATEALNAADARANSVAAGLLRFVPIAAQNQRAIGVATEQAAIVAESASAATERVDLESVTLRAGMVNVQALRAMGPQLDETAQALAHSLVAIEEVESGWVLPGLSSSISTLADEVRSLIPDADRASLAAESVPAMLGADGARSYFVMFGTPAESREFGGLLGSWVVIHFDGGRLSVGDSGRINTLFAAAAAGSLEPGTLPAWFVEMARPLTYPQNLTSSPDISVVADAFRQTLGHGFDPPIDGIVYIDTWAVNDLLQLSGPVTIAELDRQLDADTAPGFFFEDQYRIEARTELFAGLSDVAGEVVAGLASTVLPGPEELGRMLGPAARAGRLQMYSFHDEENDFLRSVRLQRDFDLGETSDFVGVVQTNATSSKLDLYLHRSVDYEVAVAADGLLRAVLRVELESRVPDDAPALALGTEAKGVNQVLLSAYSPHGVEQVLVDGRRIDFNAIEELGMNRFMADVEVAPNGAPTVIEYFLTGRVDPRQAYELTMWHQPLVHQDRVGVSYIGPGGESFDLTDELSETRVYSAAWDSESSR